MSSADARPDRMKDHVEFLLIGAAGLVGGSIHAAIAGRRFVATYYRSPVAGAVHLDITDDAAVRRLIQEVRPAVVVLAAAEAYVERCEREPLPTRRVNVEAAEVVASEVRALGSKLVVFSSDYVFDGTAGAYSEDDPLHPINEYGRQNAELESIATGAGRSIVCRTSGVFGWEPRRKNFVCQLLDRLRSGRDFDVPSDQLITPTYASALAHATLELIDLGHLGVYHVVGPSILDRLEFAGLVARTFGLPLDRLRGRPTRELGLAAPRPLRAGLRDTKLRRALGHQLVDPAEGLREMAISESPHPVPG